MYRIISISFLISSCLAVLPLTNAMHRVDLIRHSSKSIVKKVGGQPVNSSTDIDAKIIEIIIYLSGGNFLMDVYLGKSYKASLVVTTRSDLTWINCDPCHQPYVPKIFPFKESDRSTTYRELPLEDDLCRSLTETWSTDSGPCKYKYGFSGAGTYTQGVLTMERFVLGSTDNDPVDLVFGCSHLTTFNFASNVQGVVGLAGGNLSLPSQLGGKINHRFSYCLVPDAEKSKLRLGYQNEKSDKTVSTSFEFQPPRYYYYYLTLNGIIIGETEVPVPRLLTDIVIDPAVTVTFIHTHVYNKLRTLILEELDIEPTPNRRSGMFDLCFENAKLTDKSLPVTLRFSGGDVKLKHENVFVRYNGNTCLAIVANNDVSIIGNIAQTDIQVDYDLSAKQVSFTPRSCKAF